MCRQVYPKRLIEVDLPIARISTHARREKSIRHGHISTLHIWWARRPLASCRAVICAALWPDPADETCPQAFRDAAAQRIMDFARRADGDLKLLATSSEESKARWAALVKSGISPGPTDKAELLTLRGALLDFIADFANWYNTTSEPYLETSRVLTQAAHEALGGEPGTRPLVVDPFAGGGAIPVEALRVGADAFASDINPVAVLLNKVVLEYIPKYGQRLADEVRKHGAWIAEQADKDLGTFYPADKDGSTPIAYLWARTILSESPDEDDLPVEVPLMRSFWLAKKANRRIALRWVRDSNGKVKTERVEVTYSDGRSLEVRRPLMEVFCPNSERDVESGTVARGSATCPVTNHTTPVQQVRSQLKKRKGGTRDSRLLCVALTRQGSQGRFYRIATHEDSCLVKAAQRRLDDDNERHSTSLPLIPDEQFSGLEPRRIPLPQYGMTQFGDLFTSRQLLALSTIARLVRSVGTAMRAGNDPEFRVAVQTLLGMALSKEADLTNGLCGWKPDAECPVHLFARQAIPIVWDFAESVAISESSGSWRSMIERTVHSLEQAVFQTVGCATVAECSATAHILPDDSANAVVTDPPYYYSVPYSDLSDFFYVWLRRALIDCHPALFRHSVTPKQDECVQNLPHSDVADRQKDRAFYEHSMEQSLAETRRVTRPDGLSIVVFAHTETAAWESLVAALVSAGWCVVASWPIDTEMAARTVALRQKTLGSSIHLVCRPRETLDGVLRQEVGEWRDVLSELPIRTHEWMPRLAQEGVVGADAIFACLGPALEIYSRYSRVEKANGEQATLREYLEYVWAAVSTEALSLIFADADAAGLEPDSRLTAMWLWTLGGGSESAGANGNADEEDEEVEDTNDENDSGSKGKIVTGYVLEFDAARKIAQGLGIHLEKSESIVEVKGDKARLRPVSERTQYLFGKDTEAALTGRGKKKAKQQKTFFEELDEAQIAEAGWGELKGPPPGSTVLDRLHQAMILFAAGRGELLKRFLTEDGVGADARFWKLAQSFSALYPRGSDEKRWVDGVLARKKGLGL